MADRKPTGTLHWGGQYGPEQTRPINYVIDIRDFKGRAGFPWLVIAANPHLSLHVLRMWLKSEGDDYERSESWIYRRRWLFEDPKKANGIGRQPNVDGKDEYAIKIVRENPTMSARALSRLLKEHGIVRKKDWVLKHRCD
jgi:hypothetical protein